MSVLLPILDSQAFALPQSHRIDNAHQPTPARTIYYKVYRNAPRRRLGCHLSAVEMSLRSSCVTTTDVRKRLSHKIRPPSAHKLSSAETAHGLRRCCKDTNNSRNEQAFRELFGVLLLKSVECRLYKFSTSSSVKPVT